MVLCLPQPSGHAHAGAAGGAVYDDEKRKASLADAQKIYHDAGADQAAEGSSAAFSKK